MTLLATMDRMVIATPYPEWWRVLRTWVQGIVAVIAAQQGALSDEGVDSGVSSTHLAAVTPSLNPDEMRRFKELMLPLLDSAYSFARYLIRDENGAEDIVQEVYLRALKAFPQYRGGDAKSWLLAIVRNCCMTWTEKNKRQDQRLVDDEGSLNDAIASTDHGHITPEWEYDAQQRAKLIRELIQTLSEPLREVLILREIEELSYGQIAVLMQIPVGTVMSRLARARSQLFTSCQQRGLMMS